MKLYHYTSGAGLKGIVDSGELHCTRADFLNDPSETTYLNDILNEVLDSDPEYKNLYKNFGNPRHYKDLRQISYITSFSKNKDSLTMWNYYAQGNGYNIEFDVEDIIKKTKSDTQFFNFAYYDYKIIHVLYDKNKYIQSIKDIFDKLETLIGNEIIKDDRSVAYDTMSELCEQGMYFNNTLENTRFRYKDKAYENEAEVRICNIINFDGSDEAVRFKLSETGVFIEYTALKIDVENDIKSIMCHPSSTDLHTRGVERFIDNKHEYKYNCECRGSRSADLPECKCRKGLGRIDISKSTIPWRKV